MHLVMDKKPYHVWVVQLIVAVVELVLVAAVAWVVYSQYNPQTTLSTPVFCGVSAASYLVAAAFTGVSSRRALPALVAGLLRVCALQLAVLLSVLYVWGVYNVPVAFLALLVGGNVVALLVERSLRAVFLPGYTGWKPAAEVRDEARREGYLVTAQAEPLLSPAQRGMKRTADIVISLALLLTLFPLVYVVVFILTKAHRRGQVLEVVPRVSPNGDTFWCIRFRAAGCFNAMPGLLNVLKGDLSLIGPRPLTDEEAAAYAPLIAPYPVYRRLKAGLIAIDKGDVEARVATALRYSAHWNLWLDLQLMVCRRR